MKNKKNSAKISFSRLHVLHMLLVPHYWSLNKKKNKIIESDARIQNTEAEIWDGELQDAVMIIQRN